MQQCWLWQKLFPQENFLTFSKNTKSCILNITFACLRVSCWIVIYCNLLFCMQEMPYTGQHQYYHSLLQSPSGRLTYSIKTVTNLSPTNILDTNFFIISPTTGEIILARDLKTILAPNHVMVSKILCTSSEWVPLSSG